MLPSPLKILNFKYNFKLFVFGSDSVVDGAMVLGFCLYRALVSGSGLNGGKRITVSLEKISHGIPSSEYISGKS